MNIAYFWVALGGALGSVGRYWISDLVLARFGEGFPWGTLIINITGSFLIGVIGAIASPEGRMDSQSRQFASQFLMYGICGGYTTFSSFSFATLKHLQERQWLYAGGNIVLSVVLCLVAVWLGWMIGSMFSSVKQ
jgi:CrcB protein